MEECCIIEERHASCEVIENVFTACKEDLPTDTKCRDRKYTPMSNLESVLNEDGDDGKWSSFDLRVGTPEQAVRVLPSTAGSATWIVTPGGCQPVSEDCSTARGGLFNQSQSSTWKDLGPLTLALEQNLGHNESAAYGLDRISLGISNATGGPTLDNQTIAGIETEHWYVGLLGLQQQPMNLSDFSRPQPSVLSSLHTMNYIPSLSWAYTAGAHYRSKGYLGSLTFGGSDVSRYNATSVSFNLAPDVARDLVVGIQSITSTYLNGSVTSLLPSPTLAFIDSTVPYLFLPEDACKAFETELGLVYNEENNLYFVDDSLHERLSVLNPQFTFTLGNDKLSKPTVDITLPYASFDLVATPPLRQNATSYFPLRRGAEDQITLGRAFLQEAYIIADYESRNFTVAQALFDDNAKSRIVPVPWNATSLPTETKQLSKDAIIGISTGSAFIMLLIVIAIVVFMIRRKRRHKTTPTEEARPDPPIHEVRPYSFVPTQEMGHQSVQELHNDTHYIELSNGEDSVGSRSEVNGLSNDTGALQRRPSTPSTRRNPQFSLWARRFPSNGTRDPDHTSIHDIAEQAPKTLDLHLKLSSRQDQRKNKDALLSPTTGGIKYLFSASERINLNKALPSPPSANEKSKQVRSPPQSIAAAPITGNAQVLSIATVKSSRSSTYATIFDVGEYEDGSTIGEGR
ncbi:MAG: hypothetical protein Q9219_005743 [cf. Caloplaca sp. 3 TL-2023]